MPIRVVIAEDNALLRDGLARLISSIADPVLSQFVSPAYAVALLNC